MEAMLSEFDYFVPSVVQSTIVSEYDEMISPNNGLNPDAAQPLNTLDFNIAGANDLYRDLNNSYLMLKVKVVKADGSNYAVTDAVAPANLMLHTLFSNVSVTLCGKEISEKDALYPYRAYLETLLSCSEEVLKTRVVGEGWCKDDQDFNRIILVKGGNAGDPEPNSGFVKRAKAMVGGGPAVTLCGRPHSDLFHQNLDIPPNCAISVKYTPSSNAFALMGAADATAKVVLLDAKLFVRTKKVCPELVLAHKEALQQSNMRFPLNRVTVSKYGIATGFQSVSIPLNFPSRLPKRLFLAFVSNAASTGAYNENPFNFQHFGVKKLTLSVNGVQIPQNGLEMDFANKNYTRAYLNTLAALELDNQNRAIDITPADFANGYAVFGYKIAPGPVDGIVQTPANSVGSITANVEFTAALTANVDMIVFAETPGVIEIDKLSAVTLL